MKCSICFYWRKTNGAGPSKELTFEEISFISNNMRPFFWLMIGGGEPFLRKDLADICELFSKNNKVRNITIPTNGFDTDNIPGTVENILDKIGSTYLNINFSLDDIGERHDEIRGTQGAFKRAVKCFNDVKKLKNIHSNLGVAVNIVYSPLNQARILEISDYIIKDLKPDNLALIFIRGNTRDNLATDISAENYRNLIDKITVSMVRGEIPFYGIPFKNVIYAKDVLMRRIIYNTKKSASFQIPCFAGRISIVISEDGHVFPCELRGPSLGNLRERGYNLSNILTRQNRKKIKREIQKGRCFCTHECFYTMNILFNLKKYPALLREWIKLKIMKRYAAIK